MPPAMIYAKLTAAECKKNSCGDALLTVDFYLKTCCQSMPSHGAKASAPGPVLPCHGVGADFSGAICYARPALHAAAELYLAYS
ncbi:hypothetical protein ACFS07_24270 [Undibacterium arcticum]